MSFSAISKNSSARRPQSTYKDMAGSYIGDIKETASHKVEIKDLLEYPSQVARLFEQAKTTHIYIEPPLRKPVIEKRLFLLDIICDFVNLKSYWETSLQKLDNLPECISCKEIKKLLQLMLNLSQISREIFNKRYQLQKG